MQVGFVFLEHADAVSGAVVDQQLISRFGAGEAARGAAGQPELAADRADHRALRQQCMDLGPALSSAHRCAVLPLIGRDRPAM